MSMQRSWDDSGYTLTRQPTEPFLNFTLFYVKVDSHTTCVLVCSRLRADRSLTTASLPLVPARSRCTRQVCPQHRAVQSLTMSTLPLVATGFKDPVSIPFDADQSSFPLFKTGFARLHCGSPSWWRCWFRGYVAAVCDQALMSAPSLPPVLDAAQSSLHVFMTGPTASFGSMFGHSKVDKPILRWHGSSSRCPVRLPPEFTYWRTRFQRSILVIGEIQG